MVSKDEIIQTTSPEENIKCRTCKHKLEPVEVMGEIIPRYNYGVCHVFKTNKPADVLWRGEPCELYSKE